MLFVLLVALAACQNDDKKTTASTSQTPQQTLVAAPKDIAVRLDTARCFGTEPFWDVNISEKNGTIVFNNIGEEALHTLPYVKPKIEGEQAIYEAIEGKNTLKITLKSEKCSDGMSDIQHKYSSEVVFNGKKYKGCGAR